VNSPTQLVAKKHIDRHAKTEAPSGMALYFSVPPQFLEDWPESCRTPQDSAGLQAKVLILVASPAKLGRVGQSLEELGRT